MASSTTIDPLEPQLRLRQGRKRNQQPCKAPAASTKSRKKRRRQRGEIAADEFFNVKNILAQNSQQYLIDWEDDPRTGRSYSPTWEPKENANKAAVDAWKTRQGSGSQLRVGHHNSTWSSELPEESLRKSEIRDSCEREAEDGLHETAGIQVAISFHSSIDTAAYMSATAGYSPDKALATNSQSHFQDSLDIRQVSSLQIAEIPDSQEIPQGLGKDHIPSPIHPIESGGDTNTADTLQSHISWLTVKPFSNLDSATDSLQQATSGTSKGSRNPDSEALRPESQQSQGELLQQFRNRDSGRTSSSNSQPSQFAPSEIEILEIPESATESGHQNPIRQASNLTSGESTSLSEDICKGAQLISPSNFSSAPHASADKPNFEIFQDNTANSACEENSQGSTTQSILSQQSGNSTKGFSQPKEPEGRSENIVKDTSSTSQKEGHDSNSSPIIRYPDIERQASEITNFDSFLPAHLISSSGVVPETYGSSTPCKPRSLSIPDMSELQNSMDLESGANGGAKTLSVREQMRLRRAESAASRPIAITRTPSAPPTTTLSAVPSVAAGSPLPVLASVSSVSSIRSPSLMPGRVFSPQLPAVSINHARVRSNPNQTLPSRVVTASAPPLPLNPRQHDASLNEETDTEMIHSTELPRLAPIEHIVPLPLFSNIRKIYESTIRNNKREIQEFSSDDIADPQLDLRMERMVDTLKKLGDHQDIDSEETPSQANMTDDIIKKWAETCSTKCAFVRELLDALRSVEIQVLIVARLGRMLDILEAMCRSQRYSYERPDQYRDSGQSGKGLLRVKLMPTGDDRGCPTAEVVIAFDETFRTAKKEYLNHRNKPATVLSLVVTNSAEHLELCIPKTPTKSRQRTQALVNAIVDRRHEVGKLYVDDVPPDIAAARVARYLISLVSRVDSPWPLAPIGVIPGLDFSGYQFRPDSSTASTSQNSGHMLLPQAQRSSTKRSWESTDSMNPDSSKRARSTPVPGEMNASADGSRIPDTFASGGTRDAGTKYENQDLDTENAALLAKVAALSSKVTDLESQLITKQQAISSLYKVVKDRDHSIEVNIAPKYQEALNDAADARRQLKTILEKNEALANRDQQRDADIKKLKEERTAMRDEVDKARAALSGSALPEVAELARKDEEIRVLKEALERQEKKAANAEKMAEYSSSAYRDASSAFTEKEAECNAKDNIIVELTCKANDNRVICAKAQAASEKEESDQRISELEALLQDREDELARRRDELRPRGSRRETRGASVPRSPAVVPSPRVVGSRSRAGSPNIGDLERERKAGRVAQLWNDP